MLTAMVTPFTDDGALDLDGAGRLASYLVDSGNDGLVVNGTTGEAPTTSDAEKSELLRAVLDAVGDRARVIAGVGTNDTDHTVELAHRAQAIGAHGLLLVTPYYSKPPQAGLLRHFMAAADATELPVMLYDIPGRCGVPIETETLVRLADHPHILAVKDAKGDLGATSWVMARSKLVYYSGEDMLNLPLLSIGAVGFVSVVGHVAAARMRAMLDAYEAGDVTTARAVHQELLPAYTGIFRTQGVITVKAALTAMGLPGGPVRSPLVDATAQQREQLAADLAAANISTAAPVTHRSESSSASAVL